MAHFWLSFHCRKLWLMGLWGHVSMVMRLGLCIRDDGVGICIHGDGMGYGGISTYPWWWGWESLYIRIHGDCGGIYIVIGLGGHVSMVMGWELYSVSMVRAMYPWWWGIVFSQNTLQLDDGVWSLGTYCGEDILQGLFYCMIFWMRFVIDHFKNCMKFCPHNYNSSGYV